MKIVYFQRKPLPIHKSIEFIFRELRSRLPSYVQCSTVVSRFYSRGLINRLCIMMEAYFNQGDVNHITGDIHFAAILLSRKKTVLTIHDLGMLYDSAGVIHTVLKYFWFTLPVNKCAFITVVSEATKRELLKYVRFPSENIYVIPNAISSAFTYAPKVFDKIKPVILQVGITPNKNLERLVEALKGISCVLNIIGRIPDHVKDKLQQYNVSYTNSANISQEELVLQYKQCDILCLVSTYEGFGMPIVEANATGRPVITSNILSMPEVAGPAACLVDPYDTASIRNGLLKIINDDAYRNDLIKRGLENRKRFDAGQTAMQYLNIYKQIVNQ
jgi:glycosyltransferase involved in cell wall biosynthesis